MKIAILVSMFPPKHLGGTEIATLNIAKNLAQKGHNVEVITSLDEGLPKKSREDNFLIHRIYYPKIKLFGVIYFWIKCLFLIRKINSEITHVQNIQMAAPCFLAKIIFGRSYIVYCRGSDVYLPWRFKNIFSKIILNNASAVVVLSEDMKKKIQIFYPKNIFVISNGIDLVRFNGLRKEIIRRKLNIASDEKIILFVGTLKFIKGISYLIEAMGAIKEKEEKVKLILVGEGPERKRLENLTKELNLEKEINFIGGVENNKIPEYMSVSDIFILSSLSESFGIVNLEAMASGLPIVATKVGGIPEIVKDGENGFLVEPGDSKQIAEKILYLLSNDDIRKSISIANREKAKNYSWDSVVDKLIAVYSLCQNKK